ncbi:MAG: hypothetical protein CL893_01000 [Dehalococcoidia bacterium]|nr:hypothetical protein [Dehalococcoidia bacterium]|tara:strand:- start:994 stop:1659 length:666 start_codon:yes stop_codon:yes gene_type:complete
MFDFIGVAIGILFSILIISGVIFLIGYSLKNSGVKLSFDLSLNGYFYFVRLISGGVFCLAGISRILQGIFASLFGSSFSYEMISITDGIIGSENEDLGSKMMYDGSVEASLFTGITTSIISGIIYLVHVYLQNRNDISNENNNDIMFKVLVFAGTVFFGLISITALVGTIDELYKFILFDSVKEVEEWRRGVPGEPLSIAISSVIIWSITLRRLINIVAKK